MFSSIPGLYPVHADSTTPRWLLQPRRLWTLLKVPSEANMLPGKNYWHRDTIMCKDPKQQQVKEEHKKLVCLEDTDLR